MKNPQYERLVLDGHLVGIRRTVVEYLPSNADLWQLGPIRYDPDETVKLFGEPPVGIEILKRKPMRKKVE